jgi:hypothetical protein
MRVVARRGETHARQIRDRVHDDLPVLRQWLQQLWDRLSFAGPDACLAHHQASTDRSAVSACLNSCAVDPAACGPAAVQSRMDEIALYSGPA